uniref:hypothetical protein n=1 Tax=Anaplasma marginale TaxID=770 RepID=UPI001300C773
GQQLGQAGASLEEQLAMLQEQLGQQGLSQLMGLLGQGMSPTQQTLIQPGTSGLVGSLLPGIGQLFGGIGQGLGLGGGLSQILSSSSGSPQNKYLGGLLS